MIIILGMHRMKGLLFCILGIHLQAQKERIASPILHSSHDMNSSLFLRGRVVVQSHLPTTKTRYRWNLINLNSNFIDPNVRDELQSGMRR